MKMAFSLVSAAVLSALMLASAARVGDSPFANSTEPLFRLWSEYECFHTFDFRLESIQRGRFVFHAAVEANVFTLRTVGTKLSPLSAELTDGGFLRMHNKGFSIDSLGHASIKAQQNGPRNRPAALGGVA